MYIDQQSTQHVVNYHVSFSLRNHSKKSIRHCKDKSTMNLKRSIFKTVKRPKMYFEFLIFYGLLRILGTTAAVSEPFAEDAPRTQLEAVEATATRLNNSIPRTSQVLSKSLSALSAAPFASQISSSPTLAATSTSLAFLHFTEFPNSQQQQSNYTNLTALFELAGSGMPEEHYFAYFKCHRAPNRIENFVAMLLYALVCVIGLIGNTLVIYVVTRYSKMQTVTNIYILNLAIADECYLIGLPFLLYTMQVGSWQFGEIMCKTYMVSTSITQFTSSIFLLIMAADRYIAVCHPISSTLFRTPLLSKVVSVAAWLMSALLMLPVILFANIVQYGEHASCNIKWPEASNIESSKIFILYTLTLGFITPLTFIMCFYSLVIRKLRLVEIKHKPKDKKRSHRKVTKLVGTVIAVYVLCWLPYWIAQLILISQSPHRCASRYEILSYLLAGCLAYSNSAVNPLLYAFLSENFKKSFLRAFICLSQHRRGTLHDDKQHERSALRKDQSPADDDANEYLNADTSSSFKHSKSSKKSFKPDNSYFLGVTSTAGLTALTGTSFIDDGEFSQQGDAREYIAMQAIGNTLTVPTTAPAIIAAIKTSAIDEDCHSLNVKVELEPADSHGTANINNNDANKKPTTSQHCSSLLAPVTQSRSYLQSDF